MVRSGIQHPRFVAETMLKQPSFNDNEPEIELPASSTPPPFPTTANASSPLIMQDNDSDDIIFNGDRGSQQQLDLSQTFSEVMQTPASTFVPTQIVHPEDSDSPPEDLVAHSQRRLVEPARKQQTTARGNTTTRHGSSTPPPPSQMRTGGTGAKTEARPPRRGDRSAALASSTSRQGSLAPGLAPSSSSSSRSTRTQGAAAAQEPEPWVDIPDPRQYALESLGSTVVANTQVGRGSTTDKAARAKDLRSAHQTEQ
jgi:hypothetical protein